MIRVFALAAFAACVASASMAATVIAYDPTPSSGGNPPLVVGTGVTGQNLQRGPGITQPSPVPGNNYNAVGFNQTSAANALAQGDYFTWGFVSSLAYNLTTLDIAYGRSQNGPRMIEILLSVNGGPATSIYTDSSIQVGVEENPGINLSAFTNVTQAVFTLLGWDARQTTGRFSIADSVDFLDGTNAGLVVNGDAVVPLPPPITPVPLPAAFPLLLAALGSIGLVRRRRRMAA